MAPTARPRRRPGKNGRVVPRQPRLVGATQSRLTAERAAAAIADRAPRSRYRRDVARTTVTAPHSPPRLPAYNEEAALPRVLVALAAVAEESLEILVVDDGSTDRTAEIAGR